MPRAAALLAALLALAACEPAGPALAPPEGWQADGARWWAPGADTAAAFRDLSTIDAMGVRRTETEFVSWTQDEMVELYRTNPEVVDSVFGAEFLPRVLDGAPAGGDYAAAASGLVRRISTEFYQRYNPAQKVPRAEDFVLPDSLAGLSGVVTTQVYLDAESRPVAAKVLEGTGTGLDQAALYLAATGEYTPAWVRRTAGRSEGARIPVWLRIRQSFGG